MAATNQSERYRHLVGLALRTEAAPATVDIAGLPTTMIRMSPALAAKIEAVAEARGLGFKETFAGLCAAGLTTEQQIAAQASGLDVLEDAAMPFPPHSPAQRRYYQNIWRGLMHKRIVFAEGSTGVGKSRAIAAAAIAKARTGVRPIVIAAPTVAVMEHLYEECRELDCEELAMGVVPGASEFADDRALRDLFTNNDEELEVPGDQAVRDWVQQGGPCLDPERPLAKAIGPDARWLLSDLRRISTNTPVADFALRHELGDESEARNLVRKLRSVAREELDIVFCTHAMLALGQLTQWKVLPAPAALLIDEGHLLESTVSRMNSEQLSMLTLRSALARHKRKHRMSAGSSIGKAHKAAMELTRRLAALDGDESVICLSSPEALGSSTLTPILSDLERVCAALNAKALDHARGIAPLRSAATGVLRALREQNDRQTRVDLAFSLDRRFPSLYCGPSRVHTQLRNMWNTASEGVVLASATLFVMDAYGNSKCDYMRGLLAVDFDRLDTPAPVIERHIYETPELHTPTPNKARRLSPPGKNGDNRDWHQALAETLAGICDTAAGGTLVLCTSFKDVQALSELLGTGREDRIVPQSSGLPISAVVARFGAVYRDGRRPIMLAVGSAWTGIDLKDRLAEARDDFLLTDLVMTRLPIGLNRSNSMLARIERSGLYPLINEALLVFKQGLGRLIRRHGLVHRRLWVLDGRLFRPEGWKGMESLTGSAKRLLKEYKQQVTFD